LLHPFNRFYVSLVPDSIKLADHWHIRQINKQVWVIQVVSNFCAAADHTKSEAAATIPLNHELLEAKLWPEINGLRNPRLENPVCNAPMQIQAKAWPQLAIHTPART
jgi:hypothetical protein